MLEEEEEKILLKKDRKKRHWCIINLPNFQDEWLLDKEADEWLFYDHKPVD